MSDKDQSLYNLRYNQVTQGLEGFGGGSPMWTSLVLNADGAHPGGSNTAVQFNSSGAFGGSPNLTFNGTALTVGGGGNTVLINPTTPDFNVAYGSFQLDINQYRFYMAQGAGFVRYDSQLYVNDFSGTGGHDTSSLFQIDSTTTGFLPPRMTTTQRNAIASPGDGLIVYDTTLHQLWEFQNGSWVQVGNGSGITQLTGDVTAGPGSGSQVATLATVTVSKGGTGLTTLTAHDVLLGNGSSAITLLAPGTSGFVLTSNGASADPSYRPSGIGNVITTATSGTITPNALMGNTFYIAVAGAVTLNGPSNGVNGQKITIIILNDGVDSVTLATGAGNFRFGTDIPSYTNSVSLTDYIGVVWNSVAGFWDVVSIVKGF